MFRRFVLLAVAVALFTVAMGGVTTGQSAPDGDVVPGQFIVQLKSGADHGREAEDAEAKLGVKKQYVYEHAIQGV